MSSSDSVAFRFHALVTIDENGLPVGEASTDEGAVLPDGRLARNVDVVSADGYGLAVIAFDIEVPRTSMHFGHQVLVGQLVDNSVIEPALLEEPPPPATINANEPIPEEWDDFDDLDFGVDDAEV